MPAAARQDTEAIVAEHRHGQGRCGQTLARFQSVETDPDYRRRGLAGSLLYRCARYGLEELVASTLVMVAEAGYRAIDLYRAAGFEATESQLHVERGPAGRA